MNSVNLIGRVTRDLELRYSQTGTAVVKFNLAVQRKIKNSDGQYEADFISCVAFGKTAETIASYVSKGQQIGLMGHIKTGSYDNQQGQKVYTTDVFVDSFYFIGNNSNNTNHQTNQPNTPLTNNNNYSDLEISDDDLPF